MVNTVNNETLMGPYRKQASMV